MNIDNIPHADWGTEADTVLNECSLHRPLRMDKAAFIRATRRAGCTVVIAKADTTEFLRPARLSAIRTKAVLQKHSSITLIVGITPEVQAPGSAPGVLAHLWLHYGRHGQERRAEALSRLRINIVRKEISP